MEKPKLEILTKVKSAGPLTYNELEELCQITSLKDRGLFAENLRFLIRKKVVKISKIRSTNHYTLSSKGMEYIKSLKTRKEKNQ
jgi:hypothetical protein